MTVRKLPCYANFKGIIYQMKYPKMLAYSGLMITFKTSAS